MWTCRFCGNTSMEDENQFCGRCGKARDERTVDAYDLYLMGFDPAHKISVIKTVRTTTGCGLKEGKDLVEHAPQPLLFNLPNESANTMLVKLQAAGAQGEICPHGAQPSRPVMPMPSAQPSSGCAGVLLLLLVLAIGLVIAACQVF